MPSLRLLPSSGVGQGIDVTIETLWTPMPGSDADVALARTVLVALNTDRRALPDDTLPNIQDDDRRGWWGDLDAGAIWGGWPIGVRLWLMVRDKLTGPGAKSGSAVAKATRFITECLQPLVDAKICSRFEIALTQTGGDRIGGTIRIYRGPKSAIALEYEDFWKPYGA